MAEISSLYSSPALAAQLTATKLLIGEGKDELQVFTALLKHLGIEFAWDNAAFAELKSFLINLFTSQPAAGEARNES